MSHAVPSSLFTDPILCAFVPRLEATRASMLVRLAVTQRAIADTDRTLRASLAALAEPAVPDPTFGQSWADEWAAVMARRL